MVNYVKYSLVSVHTVNLGFYYKLSLDTTCKHYLNEFGQVFDHKLNRK